MTEGEGVVIVLVVSAVLVAAFLLRRSARKARTNSAESRASPVPIIAQLAYEPVLSRHVERVTADSDWRAAVQEYLTELIAGDPRLVPIPEPGESLYVVPQGEKGWLCRPNVPQEYVAAERDFTIAFRARKVALAPPQAPPPDPQAAALERWHAAWQEAEKLAKRHAQLVDRFCEIAVRRVAVIDEYGDPDRAALAPELARCISKIATREDVESSDVEDIAACAQKFIEEEFRHFEWRSASIAFPYLRSGATQFMMLAVLLANRFKNEFDERTGGSLVARQVASMSGQEFESFICDLLRRLGYQSVRGTPQNGDQGADVLASSNGEVVVIQTKRYQAPVGNRAVQEVIAALAYYGGQKAWVITNSTFTSSARALAAAAKVQLFDGEDLDLMVKKAADIEAQTSRASD